MEEATALIYKYHGGADNEVAKLEIREIETHIRNSKPQTAGDYIRGLWDYRELFSSHSARWRTGMITLITLASQFAGNTILTCKCHESSFNDSANNITVFQPVMFTALGITSVQRKLLLTFASAIVSCSGAVIGSATNDWIKRRYRYGPHLFP